MMTISEEKVCIACIVHGMARGTIHLLQADGPGTNVDIARQVQATERTVREPIAHWPTVSSRLTLPLSRQATTPTVRARGHAQWDRATAVVERIECMPEVRAVSYTLGSFRLLAEVLFAQTVNWCPFLIPGPNTIPGIVRVDVLHLLQTIKRYR